MGSWFKGFVLGIAALLGLSRAGEAPGMTMRVNRDATILYVSLELEDVPSSDLAKVVDASFTVRVRATIWAGAAKTEAFRDIRFDGLRYEVRVSETGGIHRTSDAKAAWAIASRFTRIPVARIDTLTFPIAAGCKVALDLPDDPDYDPMVVWGYKAAAAYLELDSLGHVPYY